MSRFITVDPNASAHPALLWEEGEDGSFKVVSRHDAPEDVPGHDEIPTWTFEVPTTLAAGSPVNEARQPMVDADGAPLWEGARIRFCLQSTYINTYSGDGAFGRANRYGGHSFVSDEPHPNWGPGGFSSSSGRQRSCGGGRYNYSGPLKGYNQLSDGLGDPHEHGVTQTYVRLIEDPRSVCALTHDPSSAPAP